MPKKRSEPRYPLRDSPLFRRTTRKKLAEVLQISGSSLKAILDRDDLYKRKWKHKTEEVWLTEPPMGDDAENFRPIDIPDPKLKAIQSRIANLLGRVEPPSYLFSPVKGRSYVDNAKQHRGAKAFWMLDIADYFPSCSANNVARFFHQDLECPPDVVAIFTKLTTLDGSLPQGSPCSPILAYFSNKAMWTEIATIAHQSSCNLSVYADDITISGSTVPGSLVWSIKKVVKKHGLRLKKKKEHSVIGSNAEVTGVIVTGDRTVVPNRKLKTLAELKAERGRTNNAKDRLSIDRRIAGRRAQRKQVEG